MDDSKNSTEGFLNDNECNRDDVVECTPTPRKKRKRGQRGPAIRYTEDQLTLLKSVYTETVYPTKAHVKYLTRTTQLPATIIRRWFYQRRCREGLGGSYERIHLIPQSVPQADVSSNAPNYKRFKTVLVQINSPKRSAESTPRSSSSPSSSSASNWSRMTGYPFRRNLDSFGQKPLKANLANTCRKSYPYEDIFFDGRYSTSTPKSKIESTDSGFISLADDSKCSPFTYDEPISSISDCYGQSDSVVYRRGVLNEHQSNRRANQSDLQEKVNFSRGGDILEIGPKTSILNSACGFETASPYTPGAFESLGGSVSELEPRIFGSTIEVDFTTVPESPKSVSKTVTSKPQQLPKDPVTILQYIDYTDLKKLGIGSDINYDEIPILKTGEGGPDLGHQFSENGVNGPRKGSRGPQSKRDSYIHKPNDALDHEGFNTGSTYKSTYTQTYPVEPYLCEPPPSEPHEGYYNPSDSNIATVSRNIRGRVFEDVSMACGDEHNEATEEYVYPNQGVNPEGQGAYRTHRMMLNRPTASTQVSTSTRNFHHSDLRPHLDGPQTNSGRVTAECRRDIMAQKTGSTKRSITHQSLAEHVDSNMHPGANVLERNGDALNTNSNRRWTKYSKCSRASNATDRRSSDLQQNHFGEAYTGTNVKKPANYGTLYDQASGNYSRRASSPNMVVVRPPSERKYQTMDGKSHSYREGLESGVSRPRVITFGKIDACDNVNSVDSNCMGEPSRQPFTERSHTSNHEGSKNSSPSGTQNIIKMIKVKNIPMESNEKQKTVSVDGLEAFLLNSSLNPKKCAMGDSEIRNCACHCCCCHRPLTEAPQIYILPIHTSDLGAAPSGASGDRTKN